jgi:uncharacterized protein YpbB
MSNKSRLLEIEKLLLEEQEEIEIAQRIASEVFPLLEGLSTEAITNPVILKVKLAKIDKEYRDIIYTLFRIATTYGPKGSFMTLSLTKVMSIISELQTND